MSEFTGTERSELERDLLILRGELRRALRGLDDAARPVDLEQPIGRLSRMDSIAQQSMALANREAAQVRLRQVEAGLRRLEGEEYGDCLECGEEIGFARLKVRPEAKFCLPCQSRRETQR